MRELKLDWARAQDWLSREGFGGKDLKAIATAKSTVTWKSDGENAKQEEVTPEVNLVDFLRLILPAEGYLCCAWAPIDFSATRAKKKMKLGEFIHEFSESFDRLWADIRRNDVPGRQVYHACSSFKTTANRKQENVASVKAFWFDADVGPDKPYADREDALDAVWKLCETSQIPVPLIVLSGGGIQGYWPLLDAVDEATWQPYADARPDWRWPSGFFRLPAPEF